MPKRRELSHQMRGTSSRCWLIGIVVAALLAPAADAASAPANAVRTDRRDAIGDSTVAEVRFGRPEALAIDPSGNLFIVDSELQIVRRISPDGRVATVADLARESTAPGLTFSEVNGLAVDAQDNVYLVHAEQHVVLKFDSHGVASVLAGERGKRGHLDGPIGTALLAAPTAVTLDARGRVLIAEAGGAIRRVDADGRVTTVARKLTGAYAVLVEPRGTLLVARCDGQTVFASGHEFASCEVDRVDSSGRITALAANQAFEDVHGGRGLVSRRVSANAMQCGIAIAPGGDVVSADGQRWTPPGARPSVPAPAASTNIKVFTTMPRGIAIDRSGRVFVSSWQGFIAQEDGQGSHLVAGAAPSR